MKTSSLCQGRIIVIIFNHTVLVFTISTSDYFLSQASLWSSGLRHTVQSQCPFTSVKTLCIGKHCLLIHTFARSNSSAQRQLKMYFHYSDSWLQLSIHSSSGSCLPRSESLSRVTMISSSPEQVLLHIHILQLLLENHKVFPGHVD